MEDFYDDDDDDQLTYGELEDMTEQTLNAEGLTITINPSALSTIAEAAAHRIAVNLQKEVTKIVTSRIDAMLDEAWKATIGEHARQAVDAYLTKPRTKTNSYGEAVGGSTALSEMIPKTVSEWLGRKVQDDGRESEYGKERRLDWILRTLVTSELDAEIKKAANGVTEKARAIVANQVARFVAQEMVPALELQKS